MFDLTENLASSLLGSKENPSSVILAIIGLFRGFPDSSVGKESTCNAGDLGLIPGLGRSPGEETGYSLQYSGLENSMDCVVHGVAKSRTRLSDFHFGLFRVCVVHAQLRSWLES